MRQTSVESLVALWVASSGLKGGACAAAFTPNRFVRGGVSGVIMIEPVRLAPVLSRSKKIRTLKRRAPKCGNCARKGAMYQKLDSEINNAVVFAVDWGNKPFCEECYQKYKAKKKIERDSREEIVIGPGVTKVIISEGDMLTYPQIHEWVKIDYSIRRQGDSRVIDSSAKRGKPLLYQAGCSGPCIHLQVLQANGIHAADFAFGTSDPYCAIFWRDKCVGTTRVRKLTLDPVWSTETYVLPLTKRETRWIERAALKGSLKVPRVASAGMPVLRIDMFDYDRMSKNDFLGQVTFSPLQLIRVLGLSDGDAKAFRLAPKKSRGAVGLKVRARSRPRRAVLVSKDVTRAARVAGVQGQARAPRVLRRADRQLPRPRARGSLLALGPVLPRVFQRGRHREDQGGERLPRPGL